jgi:serine/threonine-protein kinase
MFFVSLISSTLGEEDSQALAGEQRGTSSRVGSLVRGKYRIEEFISKGSMAAVYAASHRNGTRVALKVLHAVYSKDESLRTRFLREGYLANAVDHPGTVKVTDDDITEDGCVFLVMELLRGETLEQWRTKSGGRAPVEEAMLLADQLLAVLEAAHKKGIVHRDLKPENIFVTEEGQLKVLDWGVANVWDGQKSSEMTGTGMVLGTPAFMPPEQALGKRNEVDAQSDLWAIGATLFMLLSGESVHPGGDAVAKLVATARKPARSLATVAPDLPASVITAVDRSLAFKKVDRFPNATAMRLAFANAMPKFRHYGDSQDDEPTLFGTRDPDLDPSTERHLQAAEQAAELHEEQGPITLDRPTERGRGDRGRGERADQGRRDKDSVPPLTEIPVTRAPQTSPTPLMGLSLPTPGDGFGPPPSSTARMPRTSQTAAFPALSQTAALPMVRGPWSEGPGSTGNHAPMSTPLSSTQPVGVTRGDIPELAPALAPAELAGLPLPNDLTPSAPSRGRSRGLLIGLVAVVVLVAGGGLVMNKRRLTTIEPVTASTGTAAPDPSAKSAPVAPIASAASTLAAGAATSSAAPATSLTEAVPPPTSSPTDSAPAVSVASVDPPRPRPRPRPAAVVAPSADPTGTEPGSAQPSNSASPASPSGSEPAKTAEPATTAEPAKTADPLPEKIPAPLPDDPN